MRTLEPIRPSLQSDTAADPVQNTPKPVRFFAVLGVGFIALVVSGWVRWIMSDDFTPAPNGSDPFDGSKLIALHVAEVVSISAAAFLVWRFLIRSLIRERTLTFDGMLVLTAALMWFYDPLVNYFNFQFAYNTHFFDMASWTFQVPGWSYPNSNTFPEPILLIGGTYLWWICGFSMAGCFVVRRLQRRYPTMSYPTIFAVVFAVMAAMDLILEVTVIRLEFWAYPGVISKFSLFAGSRYQFPLYESLTIGIWCTGLTALRHFRDDRGLSYAERGVNELGLSRRRSKLMSFLGVTGLMHAWFLISVFVPMNLFALKVDTFPAFPSYMRAGICGDGTDMACPSPEIPIPQRTSIKVAPDDPRLSDTAREGQGLDRTDGTGDETNEDDANDEGTSG